MPSNVRKCVLAIDLGTSGPKVAIYDIQGELLDSEFVPTPLILLPGGGAEQRPDDWWNAIERGMKTVLERRPDAANDIVAISCSAQWSGTVPVDRSGAHLMNAIIWMDSRGAPCLKRIGEGPLKIEGFALPKLLHWLRLTGGLPAASGKDSLAHILYIKEYLPEIYEATYKFLEPMDYLNLRLTGRFAASYDTIALTWVTDNRDINHIDYDDRLLRMATVDREKLPDLKPVNAVLGPIKPEIAQKLGLREDVQVVMGTPDVLGAAIGSGAVRDYEGHLYIGTSSWITCHVPFKKVDVIRNMASLPAAIPGRYFVANEQETSGACLNFIRDNVFFPDDGLGTVAPEDVFVRFDKLAGQVPPGSDGLIFMPWLYGERTPVENRLLRGGFFNMSLSTTRAHMIRAVLEGVGYNLRWLCEAVEHFIKARFDGLNMIGGGAKSGIWCQILADILNRRIRQVKDPILANSRGAAFLGAVALGHLTFTDIPNRVKILNTYEPNQANRRRYDELFQEFLGLYNTNKSAFARLNRDR